MKAMQGGIAWRLNGSRCALESRLQAYMRPLPVSTAPDAGCSLERR